jgi:hypothetical protein
MAAIANALDLLLSQLSTPKDGLGATSSSGQSGMRAMLSGTYLAAFMFLVHMHDFSYVPGLSDISFLYFISSTLVLLAYISLLLKVKGTKSAAGISSQSLVLSCIGLSARVTSTSFFDGYLPADNTADYAVQAVDATTLFVVVYLLYLIHKTYVHTYEEDKDVMSNIPTVAASLVCALFIHADLNRCFFWDTVWAFSLNLEVLQTLPQLCMLAKVGGKVEKTTAHYVVNMFLACVLRVIFWIWAIPGCEDLSVEDALEKKFTEYMWDMTIGGYYILGAYLIQIIINLDFMYYFVRSWAKGDSHIYLPKMTDEI